MGELCRGALGRKHVGRVLSHQQSEKSPQNQHVLSFNPKPTLWDRDSREMGMKKALPKECLVEMQNPHRWIAPRGAAARPKGLEPPTF